MSPLMMQELSPSKVILSGTEALAEWRQQRVLKVPGHEYHPAYKRGHWDGTWTPGDWLRGGDAATAMQVSRGLVRRIVEDLGGSIDFHTVDERALAQFCREWPRFKDLRDYQARAFLKVLREGWGRVAFATNAGKGAIIAALARFIHDMTEDRALILCDEVAVFDALLGELWEWGKLRPGLVRRGVTEPPTERVVLAMVPSLANRLGKRAWAKWLVKQADMLLCDEADKCDAPTWVSILDKAKQSRWRVGFSGTFGRDLLSELKFDELLGPVVERVTNAQMVARGVSAKPLIEIHAFDATPHMEALWRVRARTWFSWTPTERRLTAYAHAVHECTARHALIASLVQPGVPTAVVVNRLAHGQALTAAIPGAVFLDGSSSETERLTMLHQFQEGQVSVLVVTKIFDRGTNRLGHAADLIFAAGEGSSTQILQRLGRGLRRAGGKEFLRLVDVVDRIEVVGASRMVKNAASFLHGAAERRLQTYAEQGFDVQLFPHRG